MVSIQKNYIPQSDLVLQTEVKLIDRFKMWENSRVKVNWLYNVEREYFFSFIVFPGEDVGLFFIIKDVVLAEHALGYKFTMFTGVLKVNDFVGKNVLDVNKLTLFCTRKFLIPTSQMIGELIEEDHFFLGSAKSIYNIFVKFLNDSYGTFEFNSGWPINGLSPF